MTSKNGKTVAVNNGRQFTHEPSGTTFTVPEPVSVATQLRYYGAAGFATGTADTFLRFWEGARVVIENWNSELLPDPKADLETLTSQRVTQVILWAGTQVANYMTEQDTVEKNS